MSDSGEPNQRPQAGDAYAARRHAMVDEQLASRGVTDPAVLEVMDDLPRERFVPGMPGSAYEDRALPIGYDQTISQPYIVAVMTQALRLQRGHRVLEIGTGSGYQTAILARLAAEVYTIERIASLAERAEAVLAEIGIASVHYRVGDGSVGWPEHAPYDRILITAGAPDVPQPLLDQLAVGGVMVLPVGQPEHQSLVEVRKEEGSWSEHPILACRFVRLIGEAGWPEADQAR